MPSITGKVETVAGPGVNALPVLLLGDNGRTEAIKTKPDGSFTFINTVAGNYTVTIVSGSLNQIRTVEIKTDQNEDEKVDFLLPSLTSKSVLVNFFMANSYLPLKYFQYVFLACVGIYFFCVLIVGKLPDLSIVSLSNSETMRGVITYLVAVTTISMAAMLMLTSTMIGGKEVKERLAMGKEILTLLIGILGTIIGFYYGSMEKGGQTNPSARNENKTTKFQLDPLITIQKGSKLTISSQFTGGTLPYSYTILSSNPKILATKESVSNDGKVSESQTIPDSIVKETELKITIMGQDSTGLKISGAHSFTVHKK